jgi:hypothetical protein
VYASATAHFATRDGKLETTVHGSIELAPDALGWPEGEPPPVFAFSGKDDLTAARGTFDLGIDPSRVQEGVMYFSLIATTGAVHGDLRIQLLEYPDEAARLAAKTPTDTPGPIWGYERAVAQFPHDACDRNGRLVALDEALPEFGGATAEALATSAAAHLGSEHPLDASWPDGKRSRAVVELAVNPAQACVTSGYGNGGNPSVWSVRMLAEAKAHSEDGALAFAMPWYDLGVAPYPADVVMVSAYEPTLGPGLVVRWPEGAGSASEGWIEETELGQSLAWPPCTHSEACDRSVDHP